MEYEKMNMINKTVYLFALLIFLIPGYLFAEKCPKYKRSMYGAWIDADGDKQDTQSEVLIEENIGNIIFKTAKQKEVLSGLWKCPFTGNEYTRVTEVINGKRKFYIDIDHIVPLGEAHESGGWKWPKEKKVKYANYLKDPNHLMAVSASANRSKGQRDIAEWPKNRETFPFIKEYARIWTSIKVKWGLTADQKELHVLHTILKNEADVIYPELADECTEVEQTTNILLPTTATIKKSNSGICHDSTSRSYKRTKNFTEFSSIEDCINSGGRLPK
jgi:hypothetical protein